jgi:hypothetical protein
VNIIIQRRHDSRYLTAPNDWNDQARDARRFQSSAEAVQYCVRQKLPEVQIVFTFENPQFDFTIAVRPHH